MVMQKIAFLETKVFYVNMPGGGTILPYGLQQRSKCNASKVKWQFEKYSISNVHLF